MTVFVAQLFSGISVGSILLLVALGLTFTFGQMGVLNMAHGELIMAGAYTTYMLQGPLGNGHLGLSLLVSLVVAFFVAGTIGVILERLLIRRLYGRSLDTLLVTWGVSLMLQQLARDLFGAPNVQVKTPSWMQGGKDALGVTFSYNRLLILALVAISTTGVWLYLTMSPMGRRTRAVVQNRQLSACSGIETARVDVSTFFLGSALAGLAGVALTQIGSVGPTLGTSYIVDAFLVVVVGGLAQLRGAVIAAMALGILNAFVERWTQASLAKVVVFVAIVAFLQFRPQGLIVSRSRALT